MNVQKPVFISASFFFFGSTEFLQFDVSFDQKKNNHILAGKISAHFYFGDVEACFIYYV